MFRELNALLDLPETHLPTGRFVLIKDTLQADGAVLLPHFLFGYLKTGKRAALLGLEQSVFHYTAVGRKLAFNLKSARAGQFMHINALSAPCDWAAPSSSAPSPTPGGGYQTSELWSLGTSEEETSLRTLYQRVKGFVEAEADDVCVIIDNLSVLFESCQQPNLVLDLVHYLQLLIRRTEHRASLVVLVHEDVEDDQALVRTLEHRADIVMTTSGLSSGYSKEVNGQLVVSGSKLPQPKRMHFKSHDASVHFMLK